MSEDNHGKASSSNFLPKNSSSQAKEGQKDKERDSFNSKYKIIDKIGEGSYSEVLKCKHRESGILVACKRLKHSYRNWHQVNDISEITTMRALPKHINILQMVETHYDQPLGKVSLVFEIMDLNLYELIKDRKRPLGENRVRLLMFQLMRAIRHLHKHGIFHRDIKPENILLRSKTDLLKLGDLGSVRGLYSRPPYTEYISTRWYRSPECLLTSGYYSFKMDIWAAACVFYEIITLRPLFPGSSEIDQVNRIHKIMGPPPSRVLQKFFKQFEIGKEYYRNRNQQARRDQIQTALEDFSSTEGKSKNFDWYFNGGDGENGIEKHLPTAIADDARDLLIAMLSYDPDPRPTAHRVLCHSYFKEAVEQYKDKDSKAPNVPLLGDEKTKQALMSMDIDLKTMGDKKLKRQKQQRYALIQKQTEAKIKASQMESKESTIILEKGSSPFTPEMEKKQTLKENSADLLHSARLSAIENLKKQNQIQAKKIIEADQKHVDLEMAQKRLSFRRKDESSERKHVDSSISSVKPPASLLKDKIDALLKTKYSIQGSDKESKLSSNISSTGLSPFSRSRLGNAGKSEAVATKLSTLDQASKLQQVYLSKPMDRKGLTLNKNALSLSASSSRSTLGKDKIANPSVVQGVPRYESVIKTKLPVLMRSEDSPFKPKAADAMSNSMFPRNRLGPASRTDATTKATLQQPATKFSQVHPVKVAERRQAVPSHGNARGGVSLPSKIDHLSNNQSHQIRPPLPPPKRIRRGPDYDFSKEELPRHEAKTLGDASSHLPIGKFHNESIVSNMENADQVQKVSEAMKRRAARIKASLREDVYCSSDEDILSSMRQKFDDIITQRVKRYYSRSNLDTNNNKPIEVAKIPDPTAERAQRLQRYTNKNI